jgi:adenylate cyclase
MQVFGWFFLDYFCKGSILIKRWILGNSLWGIYFMLNCFFKSLRFIAIKFLLLSAFSSDLSKRVLLASELNKYSVSSILGSLAFDL